MEKIPLPLKAFLYTLMTERVFFSDMLCLIEEAKNTNYSIFKYLELEKLAENFALQLLEED